MRHVERSLKIATWFLATKMTSPPIERVKSQSISAQQFSLAALAQLAQNQHFQVPRAQVVGIEPQRPIEMVKRRNPVLSQAINFRQSMIAGTGPGLIPRCLVEYIIGLVVTFEAAQGQAQVVKGLAIMGIRVPAGDPFYGFTKMALGLVEFAPTQMP